MNPSNILEAIRDQQERAGQFDDVAVDGYINPNQFASHFIDVEDDAIDSYLPADDADKSAQTIADQYKLPVKVEYAAQVYGGHEASYASKVFYPTNWPELTVENVASWIMSNVPYSRPIDAYAILRALKEQR